MWLCMCARGRGVAPEPLNKCAEGAFQVARPTTTDDEVVLELNEVEWKVVMRHNEVV